MRSDWDRMHEHQVIRDLRDAREARERYDKQLRDAVAFDNARRAARSSSSSLTFGGSGTTAGASNDEGLLGKTSTKVIDWGENLSGRIQHWFLRWKTILIYAGVLALGVCSAYFSLGNGMALNVAIGGAALYVVVPFVLAILVELLSRCLGLLIRAIPIIIGIAIVILVLDFLGSA